jgi:hypothetical protein
MTENQKLWLDELITDYRGAASNERLWSKGANDEEQARMHEENAVELTEFADILETLKED